jgi:hypothetical protein
MGCGAGTIFSILGCDATILVMNIPVSRRPAVAMANHLFDVITPPDLALTVRTVLG